METAFNRLNLLRIVWDTLQELSGEGRRKLFVNSKIFRMLSQTNGMMPHQTARIREVIYSSGKSI